MSQVYSPSAALVNSVNNKLAVSENEGYAKMGARTVSRAVAQTALAPLALIETVVFAIIAAVASPLALTSKTKPAFEWAKEHTLVAANASKNAFAGTVGRGEVTPKEEPAAPKTKFEQAKEKAAEFYAKAMNLVQTTYNKTERKHLVGLAGLVAGAMILYYFNAHGKTYDLGAWGVGKSVNVLSWGFNKAGDIKDGAKDLVSPYTPGFVKTGYHAVGTAASYAATPFTATYNYGASFFASEVVQEAAKKTVENATSAA